MTDGGDAIMAEIKVQRLKELEEQRKREELKRKMAEEKAA